VWEEADIRLGLQAEKEVNMAEILSAFLLISGKRQK
jgi:hypothetical protein